MANSDDQAGSNRPNVVFILVDNVGWGDIGCYGGVVPTPRIDALAGQGVRFKNYNVEAQCTPTRSAILSGRLPIRTGNCSGELFSDAGYATGAFGKWHVGDKEGRLPTDQGFDEWYGIKNTSDESAYSTYPCSPSPVFPCPRSGRV
jgi:arylsulfatase A-like enzyme